MHFLISSPSPLFDDLLQINQRGRQCIEEAGSLAEDLGCTQYISLSGSNIYAGGISGFIFDKHPGKDWKSAGMPKVSRMAYYPKKLRRNNELLSRINSLPTVMWNEFNDRINHATPITIREKSLWIWHPGVSWIKKDGEFDALIISVSDNAYQYQPVEGMVEITLSAARTLLNNPRYTG